MRTETLKKRMLKHEQSFDKLWACIIKDVNIYVETNPESTFYPFKFSNIDMFIDSLCLSGAWIQDRLDKKTGSPDSNEYKGSLTKKIREALNI